MQNDERNSSLSRKDLITFVGFKSHLVLRFVEDNLRFSPNNIYIFTSKKQLNNGEISDSEKILENLTEISKNKKFKIIQYREHDLWDIKLYFKKLSELPKVPFVINISAGPAVFAAAGMLWALERNNDISFSVEHYENNILLSTIFKNINLKSISNVIYATDNIDRYIIEAIKAGRNDSNSIMKYLKDSFQYSLGLRTIQQHIKKMEGLKIIRISGSKSYHIDFSGDLNDLGYQASNFYK